MTIAIAWTRTISGCEELVFVTDSRLTDGTNFDACPKALTLPREDCAIAFAGYTGHAYPMMHQLSLAIESHAPLLRGSLDLPAVKSHALKIFNAMAGQIRSSLGMSVPADTLPEAEFLFGGYSWVKKQFELWRFSYNVGAKAFRADPAQFICYSQRLGKVVARASKNPSDPRLGQIVFAGDQAPVARKLLFERLNAGDPAKAALDWLPFEVVRDMLRDPLHSDTIGGSPQIVKVYQYMRSTSLAVYWPNRASGKPHLLGRALLGYERTEKFILDPDTLRSEAHAANFPAPLDTENSILVSEDRDREDEVEESKAAP